MLKIIAAILGMTCGILINAYIQYIWSRQHIEKIKREIELYHNK